MDASPETYTNLATVLWMWMFPVTYLIHIAEEFWGGEGYLAYLFRLRGVEISPTRFFVLQGVGVLLIIAGIIISQQLHFTRFMLVLLGAIVLSNGITHTITAIRDGGYGPGLVSCVLIWIPLGLVTLIRLVGQPNTIQYVVAMMTGFAINGAVAIIALRGGR